MPDRDSLDHVDDVLPDVRREVADPLEVAADEDDLQAPGQVVFRHMRDHHPAQRVLELVQAVVARDHGACGVRVPVHERVERIPQHRPRHAAHLVEFGRDRHLLLGLRQPFRRFGDVDRVVADPLEVVVDLEDRDEHAQVARHRMVEREDLHRGFLDLHLGPVDGVVGLPNRLRIDRGLAHERHRALNQLLDVVRHLVQRPRDVADPVVELPEGHRSRPVRQPRRPVM